MNRPLRHHLNALSMSMSTSTESARAYGLKGPRIPAATLGDIRLNRDVRGAGHTPQHAGGAWLRAMTRTSLPKSP
jgi:hypothetical protein